MVSLYCIDNDQTGHRTRRSYHDLCVINELRVNALLVW